MRETLRALSFTFSAGVFGAIINSLTVVLFSHYGWAVAAGYKLQVNLSPPGIYEWIYRRLVWGGFWGLLFLTPFFRSMPPVRIVVFALAPSIFQLLVVFPYFVNKGFLGLELGASTPLFVIGFNIVWALFAEIWLKIASQKW
ncbi:MAG: hypothetical protein PHS86_06500 [Syntrophaceae bacterium]|nr:hypothetical protein [Syntrophaceae bacterium]